MSICPKNKQMRRINDASQSLQGLRQLQQKRNYSAGLIEKRRQTENHLSKDGSLFFITFFM